MPVTAKLSRKFYERFGDEITGELVDWFNAVDTTYQTQLRELNDLNWERFKAHLDGEISSLRSELRGEMNVLRAELRAEMQVGFAGIRLEMERFRSSMMKWMFVYWTATIATIL
ncbi:MAG: hypothetical protein H0U64_13190, partial [Gemmatimonadaceae bacterium]|nr:hypothetical protein [Gemmatimonadaceae bacterium]